MLNRAAFVVMLIGFVGGTLLIVAGLAFRRWDFLVAGGGAWLSAGVVRHWLERTGSFQATKESLDTLPFNGTAVDDSRVAELTCLLQQWDALERKRGTAEFDPWALQAVRHDIHELVAGDPALTALFHDHRLAQVA